MDETSIEFQSILPVNQVLTLAQGIASFFALALENGNELWLIKFTEERNVLWRRMLGKYNEFSIPIGNYTLMEDAQAFIHVVTGFLGTFEPHFNNLKNPESYSSIVMKLSNFGEVLQIERRSNVLSYQLVKIVNDVWIVSVEKSGCNRVAFIKNLTKNGGITTMISKGSIVISDAYHIGNKLFLAGGGNQDIMYRGQTLKLDQPSAILAIINTETWDLVDYFIVTPVKEIIQSCEQETPGDDACVNFAVYSSVVVDTSDNYYIAGYVKGRRISVYYKEDLLKTVSLGFDNSLMICKISKIDPVKSLAVDNINFRCAHMPFNPENVGVTQLFHMAKDDNIILIGRADEFTLLDYLEIDRTLHTARHTYMLRFSANLEIQDFVSASSGAPDSVIARDCTCSDCPGDSNCRYIPCRITRLFATGPTTAAANGDDKNGNNCTDDAFSGFSCVTDSVGTFTGTCFYTCFNGNGHCLPHTCCGQPGDLYNTKYKGVNLAQADSITNSDFLILPQQDSKIAISNVDNILVSETLIDNLVINGSINKSLYKQKWYGYILNFNYI